MKKKQLFSLKLLNINLSFFVFKNHYLTPSYLSYHNKIVKEIKQNKNSKSHTNTKKNTKMKKKP